MVDFSRWNLSKSQQRIADYIHKNMDLIPFMNEVELAKACSTSIATISRFWGAIGFKNLKEFKQYLKQEAVVTPASKVESALEKYGDTNIDLMMDTAIQYISETKRHLSTKDFQASIDAIVQAKKIHLYGAGSSQGLVSLLAFRLRRFECNVHLLAPSGHEIFESMIHMEKGDVFILFGFVQASVEINVLLDYAAKKEICTILITDLLVSPMLEQSTYVLYTSRGDVGDFHSMVAPVALLEIIIVNVGKKLGNALNKLHELHQIRKEYRDMLPKK